MKCKEWNIYVFHFAFCILHLAFCISLHVANSTYIGMVFAAGLGTRFKPWTDTHPKALAQVNGKTLLQRNIEYLQRAGITEVVVNVHHFSEQVKMALQESGGWGSRIYISDESGQLLETGGGLKFARNLFGEKNIVVINVDILTDLDLSAMIRFHEEHHPLATLAVSDRVTSRYLLFDRDLRLAGWRNTRTGEEKIAQACDQYIQKAFSGIHVIDHSIFQWMQQEGKFSMIDVYLSLAANHEILGYDHTGSRLIDVGKPDSVVEAELLFPESEK